MRILLVVILILFSAASVNAGPAAYSSVKIYILTKELRDPPTPEYIRKHANIVISTVDTVEFVASLDWEKAKHDPTIKQRAAPLVMIIDLYKRVQPDPPEEPTFDTLYCTRKYAYSEKGNYIEISALTTDTLKFPIRKLNR